MISCKRKATVSTRDNIGTSSLALVRDARPFRYSGYAPHPNFPTEQVFITMELAGGFRMPRPTLWVSYYSRRHELIQDRPERARNDVENVDHPRYNPARVQKHLGSDQLPV
ncbi:hypothetical protein KM043_014301 [Ampulex compressa]|nr:hypothetical protein KM043_014301 [Ampulex compressa]